MLWRSRYWTKPQPACGCSLPVQCGRQSSKVFAPIRSKPNFLSPSRNSLDAEWFMQRLPVEDSLASAGQMALSKNGPDYDGVGVGGMIGLSSEKSDRDDPDVPLAEAGSGRGLSDFSGNLPLHPWLSLILLCWRTPLFVTIRGYSPDLPATSDCCRKRGVVWCRLQIHGRTTVVGRTHPKLWLMIASLLCFS